MSPALAFLASLGKFGKRGGWIPGIRVLTESLVIAGEVAEQEVEAGRVSTPDYYSDAIQEYERSALGSTRII
jgi:hypothetical protein